MGFSLSAAMKSAIEEGLLVFFTVEGSGFAANAAGVAVGFPSGAFTAAALLAAAVAAVRDYMQAEPAAVAAPAA
jgi:hypothetical protein